MVNNHGKIVVDVRGAGMGGQHILLNFRQKGRGIAVYLFQLIFQIIEDADVDAFADFIRKLLDPDFSYDVA